MKDDDAKKIILARRARFIAAAMVSAGAAAGCDKCNPMVCLEPAPTTCLKVAVVYDAGPPVDGSAIGPPTAEEADAAVGPPTAMPPTTGVPSPDAAAAPTVCLKPLANPGGKKK